MVFLSLQRVHSIPSYSKSKQVGASEPHESSCCSLGVFMTGGRMALRSEENRRVELSSEAHHILGSASAGRAHRPRSIYWMRLAVVRFPLPLCALRFLPRAPFGGVRVSVDNSEDAEQVVYLYQSFYCFLVDLFSLAA